MQSSTGFTVTCTIGPLYNASALVTVQVNSVPVKGALFLTSVPTPQVLGISTLPSNGGSVTLIGAGFSMNTAGLTVTIGTISMIYNVSI